MVCICARAASTTCSGHPSAAAAAAILSMTCLLFFSLVLSVSLRQVHIALRAAFTASRASFESPGTDTGLKLRGVTSTNLLCIVGSSSRFSTEIEDMRFLNTLIPTREFRFQACYEPTGALVRRTLRESIRDNIHLRLVLQPIVCDS